MSAKMAIVAGAGGALGHAAAVALAASGLTVVAVDRTERALRELPDGVRPEVADTTHTFTVVRGRSGLRCSGRANHRDQVTPPHLPGGKPGSGPPPGREFPRRD
jgi:NAD(P)-dependent dehydrogenase (short-subunit alcohol dehydrogenase family)